MAADIKTTERGAHMCRRDFSSHEVGGADDDDRRRCSGDHEVHGRKMSSGPGGPGGRKSVTH